MQPAAPVPVVGDFFVGSEAEFRQWVATLQRDLTMPAAANAPDRRLVPRTAKEVRTRAHVDKLVRDYEAGIVPHSIDFSNSDISLESLHALMSSLSFGAGLCELYLSNNRIGDEGAFVLARSLERLPFLNTIYLSGNAVADKGACLLASSLQRNTSLTTLDLYSMLLAIFAHLNRVGDAGATSISHMLMANVSLLILNLKGNLIGPPGQVALARAMAQNATIQSLIVDENTGMDTAAIASITQSIGVNTDPKQKIKLHFKKLNHLRRAEDMRPNIRAYVNKPDFSDFVIECSGGSCVAHKAILLARAPHLYRKWCPTLSSKSVSIPELPRAALMCLLEHIYGLEVIFMDLGTEASAALRKFAKENEFPALCSTLSDSNSLDVIPEYKLSQEALLSVPDLSDVSLIADDNPSPIQAHRVILAARSQYFHALFTSGLKETNEQSVRLAKPRALVASVVEFVYTGDVATINSEIAIDLLLASLEYRLPGLQTIVEAMVADAVDAENVQDLTALAEEQNLEVLAASCRLFSARGWAEHPAHAEPAVPAATAAPDVRNAQPPQPRPYNDVPQPFVPRQDAQIRQTCVMQ